MLGLMLTHTKCFKSRFAKVTSHTNRHVILYISHSQGYVGGFEGELASAKQFQQHVVRQDGVLARAAHKKTPPHRTLPQAYAYGRRGFIGGWAFSYGQGPREARAPGDKANACQERKSLLKL